MGAALAVEFADELVDGAKSAGLPLIRHSIGLSYGQLGLLLAIPLFAGSLIELPVGLLAGRGSRRHWFVLGGGIVFAASVAAIALARSFGVLLAAFVVFFPASGAFVSLTQAALMDAVPARQARNLASWTLAGSVGAVTGSLLIAALAGFGGWRAAFAVVAGVGIAALAMTAVTGPSRIRGQARQPAAAGAPASRDAGRSRGWRTGPAAVRGWWLASRRNLRETRLALRDGVVLRWLILLPLSDLLLDVFGGFTAVYLVAVAHASAVQAALGVAVQLTAGLAGDACLVLILRRRSEAAVLRAASCALAVLYPAFLLVPGFAAKLVVLAVLSIAASGWYPVLQAGLYGSLPGRSDMAVSLTSAAALAGAAGPLAVGFVAQRFGLPLALGMLAVVPVLILAGQPRAARPAAGDQPPAPRTTGRPAGS